MLSGSPMSGMPRGKGKIIKRYTAKSGTWFDEGTEALPVTGFWNCDELEDGEYVTTQCAIFLGIRNGKPDEEGCTVLEFEVTEIDDEEQDTRIR